MHIVGKTGYEHEYLLYESRARLTSDQLLYKYSGGKLLSPEVFL